MPEQRDAEGYATVRAGSLWAPPRRDQVVVIGPDAATYLQGQLSQNVIALKVDAMAWTFLLDPSGKLGFWLRVTRETSETFILDGDPGCGPDVVARLLRFKLRTAAEIELRAAPTSSDGSADPELMASRIEAGIPSFGAELVDDVIPAELGQWFIDASVNFSKGCYTGQELVARIDSRGANVPRNLRGFILEGREVVPPGVEVTSGGKVVGTVTSSTYSAKLRAPIALGFVHRTIIPSSRVTLVWDDQMVSAEVRELPMVTDQ